MYIFVGVFYNYDVLRDLVPFVQFKKRVNSSMSLFTFFKMYKWHQIVQCITYLEKDQSQQEIISVYSFLFFMFPTLFQCLSYKNHV